MTPIEDRIREALRAAQPEPTLNLESDPCGWRPPDLRPGGEWYAARVENLLAAVSHYPGKEIELANQGLDDLQVHRSNYDEYGAAPTRLRILWWEFPPEHWDNLREGSPMNFMGPPPRGIQPNGDMDPDQLRVATEFLEELVSLGVVGTPPPDCVVEATTPLFALPKTGQPDQFRMIANMLLGGQNEVAANDPVYLNRPVHILDQMYTGGWSAVVDASKFFYQFRSRPEDQKYLGLIHPVTQEMYVWTALPMGAANSPACAGRYGLAFLRKLREALYPGGHQMKANCWWTKLESTGYDPKLGYGYVLHRGDGQPAVRFFVHVDDFLIHGRTRRETEEALIFFLDLAVDVGLLCHPDKLRPPNQVVLYTGFIFDTRGTPTLRVPTEKRERALAMVQHIRHRPKTTWSRLALSVLTGTLESVSDATPSRLGHTYLRRLYDAIHMPGMAVGEDKYRSFTTLPEVVMEDLKWWELILETDLCRPSRLLSSSTIVPTFGDGSGTGTGGTIQLPGQDLMLWMGQWSPFVFHQTSNWKELKTLCLTLQALTELPENPVTGATVFYFTDNLVTYYICASGSSSSPGLQRLVEDIRHLEIILRCQLQCIHIPGKAMIAQGTDGLSRGIWFSQLHSGVNQATLTASIFRPLPFQTHLEDRYSSLLGWEPGQCIRSTWDRPVEGVDLLHRRTFHYPPPELARQTIVFFLEAWVESPLDTGSIFFVPRVLPACWHGLSKHVMELDLVPASDIHPSPLLPIPVIVLVVLPFSRVLTRKKQPALDSDRDTSGEQRAHKRAADHLRGLQPAPVKPSY
jgi:hypothetical protein